MVRRLVALFLLAMFAACTTIPTAPPAESGGIATSGG